MANKNKDINKKIVPIKGMHCRSCEILLEEEIGKIPGVSNVHVSEKKGVAEIRCSRDIADSKIEEAVKNAGYETGVEETKWFSTKTSDYKDLIKAAGFILVLYLAFDKLGLLNLSFTKSADYSSLPVVFLVGITAGLSTCMALVGGIVMAVSARFAEKNASLAPLQKFKPHIYFNLGRVVFFLLFGGLLGLVGSAVQFSTATLGYMTIFVGIVMLLLGLQTLEIFPLLSKFKLTLPKSLYKALGISNYQRNEYSHKGAFISGGLTFFLPCGFTQVMQLFAVSSGSVSTGALTMGIFALGTTPGLLAVGGLTSAVTGAFTKPLFKFVGLLVILFSAYNISNGINLSGLRVGNDPALAEVSAPDGSVPCVSGLDPDTAAAYASKYGEDALCDAVGDSQVVPPTNGGTGGGCSSVTGSIYSQNRHAAKFIYR